MRAHTQTHSTQRTQLKYSWGWDYTTFVRYFVAVLASIFHFSSFCASYAIKCVERRQKAYTQITVKTNHTQNHNRAAHTAQNSGFYRFTSSARLFSDSLSGCAGFVFCCCSIMKHIRFLLCAPRSFVRRILVVMERQRPRQQQKKKRKHRI